MAIGANSTNASANETALAEFLAIVLLNRFSNICILGCRPLRRRMRSPDHFVARSTRFADMEKARTLGGGPRLPC